MTNIPKPPIVIVHDIRLLTIEELEEMAGLIELAISEDLSDLTPEQMVDKLVNRSS